MIMLEYILLSGEGNRDKPSTIEETVLIVVGPGMYRPPR